LVSHHFADDFGQSIAKPLLMQNITTTESIIDVYMGKKVDEMMFDKRYRIKRQKLRSKFLSLMTWLFIE
jgi:hypothetical protein